MMLLKTIIVDDEAHCIEALAKMLSTNYKHCRIVAKCTDGLDAIEKIDKFHPDIVFLDIEMPAPNGLEVLDYINRKYNNINVIFTTAHSEYAVKAFRLSAFDYLMKPITDEDLSDVMKHLDEKRRQEEKSLQFEILNEAIHHDKKSKPNDRIALPSGDGLEIVQISQITFLSAEEGYCNFHLADGRKILVSRKIGEFEGLLDEEVFLRLHRSYIVNFNYIKKYHRGEGGQVQMSGGQWVDVSRTKKEELLKRLGIKA